VSPAAGSLHDVRRMLTQFVRTFPSFSHALLGGEANNLSSVTEKGHKERYCSDQGKGSTLYGTLLFFFFKSRGWK